MNWLLKITHYIAIIVILGGMWVGLPPLPNGRVGDVVPTALAQNTATPATTSTGGDLPKYNPGVDVQLTNFLCTPEASAQGTATPPVDFDESNIIELDGGKPGQSGNPSDNGTSLIHCINRLYRFAISAGAIFLVLMIVIAGYQYIIGGESGKKTAKDTLFASVTGMIILLSSYALLATINPNLTNIRTIQPPIFSSAKLPTCEDVGFAADCLSATGQTVAGTGVSPAMAPTGTAQELAQRLLKNPRVTFINRRNDGTGAKSNIESTAAGQPAKRSCYGTAPCGSVALSATMLQGLINLSQKFPLQVSEFVGGSHASNSRHYAGIGFDVSPVPKGWRNADCVSLGATEVLGPGAEGHSTHIHCAWPRGSK